MTSNTATPTKCNHNTCSAYTAKNQGAEATACDQVGDSKSVALPITFTDAMGLDWGSLLRSLSPIHSQKQNVSGDLVDDVPNYHHDGVPLQNGTNDPIAYISKLLDLMPSDPDESLPNDPSSQKTIAFDPRPRFMESDMDDGSHSAPNAKKLNALFYPTVQDSMRSVEINREAVSSGSYNDGGTSSIRSSYEFGY
ncbi:uncharacterized protein LOC132167815 [Corylus avellana]|uniref:uncharacterized protein LOC132167815 n=1 Tax=Corylus avellana TaxID=13451 RepID=UPI00286D5D20|nr:uncharacterized protein LOC132167815 [Corylus avellana]